MKKTTKYICLFIMLCSSLGLAISFANKGIMRDEMNRLAYYESNIGDDIMEEFVDLKQYLPNENEDAFDRILTQIKVDGHLQVVITPYLRSLKKDLVLHKGKNLPENLNQKVKDFLLTYRDDFKKLMSSSLSSEEQNMIIEKTVDKIDMNLYYQNSLDKIEKQIQPSDLKVIIFMGVLSRSLITIMFLCFLFGSLIFYYRKQKQEDWLKPLATTFFVSGIILVVLGSILEPFINHYLIRFIIMIGYFGDNAKNILYINGLFYIFLGICLLFIKGEYQKKIE